MGQEPRHVFGRYRRINDNVAKYNACLAGQYPGDENTYAEKAIELGKSIGLSEEDIFEISI